MSCLALNPLFILGFFFLLYSVSLEKLNTSEGLRNHQARCRHSNLIYVVQMTWKSLRTGTGPDMSSKGWERKKLTPLQPPWIPMKHSDGAESLGSRKFCFPCKLFQQMTYHFYRTPSQASFNKGKMLTMLVWKNCLSLGIFLRKTNKTSGRWKHWW